MMETRTYEVFLGDLPGSVVSCWYLREGERLTPGPLVSLRTNSHTYTLLITGTERELQGGILQRIVFAEGAQVGQHFRLALVQVDDTLPERAPCLPTIAREQTMLFSEGLLIHRYAPLHTQLVLRFDRYRHLYRRCYPLFELRRHALPLCVILGCWLLLQSLDSQLGGTTMSPWLIKLSTWGLWLVLAVFGLLLVLASIQVISLERRRRRWKNPLPGTERTRDRS